MKISVSSVKEVVQGCLHASGVSDESIDVIVDTMLYADRRGLNSHGIGRLPLYVKKIAAGHLNPKNETEIVMSHDAVAIIDGHNGFGQIAADKALREGIAKAERYGVSAVGVRKSNNFGTAGYFGRCAAEQGLAAMIFANAAPAIAPSGGNKAMFGTNPICFAFPGGKGNAPIILDMATSVAARGKIRLAEKNGDRIPLNWAMDEYGNPTDDPKAALKGTLQPVGGVKGYGLSLFSDIFAGLLTGAAYGGNVRQLSDIYNDSGNGHLFLLIDVKKFIDKDLLHSIVKEYINTVKSCGDDGRVFMPGELGDKKTEEHGNWIELSEAQIKEINETALSCGCSVKLEVIR